MKNSKIVATGSYLPKKVLSNADLEKMVDTSDEWIQSRAGIKSRHIVGDETLLDMLEHSAKQIIERAGIAVNDIDGIIVGTTSNDYIFPSAGNLLQARLGITNNCGSFDVQAACSGFIYALSIADQFIKTGAMKNILVMGAEAISRYINWEDRATCVLFGDGAGGVLLTASEEPGLLSTHIHSDGRYKDCLHAANNWHEKGDMVKRPEIVMVGKEVFKAAVNTLNDIVTEVLEANKLEKSDITWLVPHQANMRIITATAKNIRLANGQGSGDC
jgi:3-oxoacyl-[acyl-carrier-protein] synthase-3